MRNIIRVCFSVFFIVLCFRTAHAQQGNVWEFENHRGLDFNYTPPKIISSSLSDSISQSAASIADCHGKMLFYGTIGLIYNRYDKRMPNGSSNTNGSGTIYIVPFPNDSSKY